MKIKDTLLADKAIQFFCNDMGDVFFFENIVVIELFEGAHLDLESGMEIFGMIHEFYGSEKKIGVISNRVNQFSKSPIDFKKIQMLMTNVIIYCPVTYNLQETQNTKLESQFYDLNNKNFSDIITAFDWVSQFMLENTNQNNHLNDKKCV